MDIRLMKHLASIWLCMFAISALGQGSPPAGGVYLLQSDHWQRLDVTNEEGPPSVRGEWNAVDWFFVYPNAHAATAVSGAKPVFCWNGFNDNISPRSVLIVRLAQKKNHRELQTIMGDDPNHLMEYLPQDRIEVQIRDDGDERTVTPETDLAPGEYMLFTGVSDIMLASGGRFTGAAQTRGFDFQVK